MKQLRFIRIFIGFLVVCMCACTVTRMTAMKSDLSHGKTYQSILFIAGNDLRTQKKSFEQFSKAISQKSSTKLISVYDLFFPKRLYTKKEIDKIVKGKAIDGILVVNLGNQKAVESGF